MQITHLYTGDDNQSHFEQLDIPVHAGRYGAVADPFTSDGVVFRQTEPGGVLDWHTAPRRQFVLTLSGKVEIEIGDGSTRRLGPGDLLLANDTTGQGHITRDVTGPRKTVIIPLPEDFDLDAWRR